MLNNVLIVSLVSGLLVSCGKKNENTPAETPKKTEAPATDVKPANAPTAADNTQAGVLVVKAAKLKIDKGANNPDGPDALELDDSGNLLVKGETVLTLGADGKVVDKDGKLVASITAEGLLSFEGEEETVTIAEDGSVVADGKTVSTIGDDGVVAMAGMSEKVVFEGPAESRRAMMVAFLTANMPVDAQDSAAKAADVAAGELVDLKAGDEGCNVTFEGRCFKTDVDACRAGGCELADCAIAESMPGQASCTKK